MTTKVVASGSLDIIITREFDAPRELVFDAWTKPELVKRWFGMRNGWEFVTCDIDLRPGGAYRYVWRKGGKDMGMGGVYEEVSRPGRYVCSERFDAFDDEAHVTTEFIEKNGKTTYKCTSRSTSQEARDGVLKSPMESGLEESFQKLDQVLKR